MRQGCSPWEERVENPIWPAWTSGLLIMAAAVAQPRSLRGLQDAPSVPEPPCLCLGLLPLESRGVELGVGPWRPGCQPV